MKKWLYTFIYRLRQVHQQLGFVAPLSVEERAEVARWLPASAIPLFQTMTAADQQHALRVCRGLQAHGCTDKDLLAAALLHDVGKAQGRVPFWTRPVIVIGKRCAPRLLSRLVFYPGVVGSLPDTFLLKDSRPLGRSQIKRAAWAVRGGATNCPCRTKRIGPLAGRWKKIEQEFE